MIEGLIQVAGALIIGAIGLGCIFVFTLLIAVLINEIKNRILD